ncbi:MAG: fatty acid--CoA ligase family protein [Pseudomonadota bacterium]
MPEATISRLAEALPGLILVNAYGSTEVTSPATIMPLGEGTRHSNSVGKCVPCGHIRVVDDTGNDVPVGAAGELWIAGPMVVPGYWEDDEKTREGFHEGYWKSGDIGSCDAEGFYYLHDRKKDMVIRGGYNIYTAELENVIADLPDVIECAVVGREDKVLGEKTHVFIYGSDTLSRDAVRNHCAKHLADYKVPDFITFLTAPLPRNANGKVLKAQLRQLAKAEPA